MRNILFLARHLNLIDGGGSSHSLHTIASELSDGRFHVDVHITDTVKISGELPYSVTDLTDNFDDTNYVYRAKKIKDHLSNCYPDYDLIHIFSPSYLSIAGYNKRDTPVVGRINTYTPFCTNLGLMDGECHNNCTIQKKIAHDPRKTHEKFFRSPRYVSQDLIEPNYIKKIDKLFAISPSIKRVYTEYGYPNDLITVIPNIPEESFYRKKPKKFNTDNNLSLLYIGRLKKQKGLRFLFEALKNIHRYDIDVEIVGDGDQYKQLDCMRKEMPENINATLHGNVKHESISEYFLRADLFVHPHTWPEPFGRVILESLQHQCPVLCSEIGAPSWIAGDACETIPPNNVQQIEEKIIDLYLNPWKLRAMSEESQAELKKFQKKNVTEDIILNYNQILD